MCGLNDLSKNTRSAIATKLANKFDFHSDTLTDLALMNKLMPLAFRVQKFALHYLTFPLIVITLYQVVPTCTLYK